MKYRVSRVLAGPILHLLWRPEVIGGEHIPATGGAILASNHLSLVDSIFLPLMLARPVTFAAKSEYFTGKRPGQRIAAAYLRATSQLSVDRAGARAAQETLQAALGLLQAGELFGIYPEGTRSPDGRLYRGRTGVGWLALASGLPVIPVAMVGTDRVLAPGHTVPSLHRVGIRVGEPLTFEQYRDHQPAGPGPQGSHRRGDKGHRRAVRAGVRADVRVGPQGGAVQPGGRAGPLSARPGCTPGHITHAGGRGAGALMPHRRRRRSVLAVRGRAVLGSPYRREQAECVFQVSPRPHGREALDAVARV